MVVGVRVEGEGGAIVGTAVDKHTCGERLKSGRGGSDEDGVEICGAIF